MGILLFLIFLTCKFQRSGIRRSSQTFCNATVLFCAPLYTLQTYSWTVFQMATDQPSCGEMIYCWDLIIYGAIWKPPFLLSRERFLNSIERYLPTWPHSGLPIHPHRKPPFCLAPLPFHINVLLTNISRTWFNLISQGRPDIFRDMLCSMVS